MYINTDEEKIKLLEEINGLKKSLKWYKDTYEERSVSGIVYDRILKKYFNFLSNKKIKIQKTQSLLSNKILCTIVNHNYSKNATTLQELLLKYYDTIILDSGSDYPPKNSIKLGNIYYSGLLNKAYSIAKNENYNYLLFICSDVLISSTEALKMFERTTTMDLSKIGLYSPASSGLSHHFCKKQSSGKLREVPFVEGFIFLCDMEILNHICPIDTQENLYGWGLDIVKAFYAKANNKLCVIDDNVEVEHLAGTGYSREIAKVEMFSWIKSINDKALTDFFENYVNLVNS